MADDRRTADPAAARQRELDRRVEELTQRLAEVIESAGEEGRQGLREYAIELLKEETERGPTPAGGASGTTAVAFSPLAVAFLLLVPGLVLLVLFTPLGLALVVVAIVLGLWGVAQTFLRR